MWTNSSSQLNKQYLNKWTLHVNSWLRLLGDLYMWITGSSISLTPRPHIHTWCLTTFSAFMQTDKNLAYFHTSILQLLHRIPVAFESAKGSDLRQNMIIWVFFPLCKCAWYGYWKNFISKVNRIESSSPKEILSSLLSRCLFSHTHSAAVYWSIHLKLPQKTLKWSNIVNTFKITIENIEMVQYFQSVSFYHNFSNSFIWKYDYCDRIVWLYFRNVFFIQS